MIIGFIGLGHMGFPMAVQLLKHDFNVYAYDPIASTREQFQTMGGHTTEDTESIAKVADIIITMIPSEKHLFEIYNHAFVRHLKKSSLCIDCSTVGPIASGKWHSLLNDAQIPHLDAPVSGGVAAATQGHLTFMVGGAEELLKKATPILSAMGLNIIHTGENGTGQAAKICNNLILASNMIAASEAFKLAKAFGLPFEKLHQIASNSSGQSWVLDKYVPVPHLLENVPANKDYQPGFSCQMMLKDLNIVEQAMQEYGLSLELTHKSYEIYQKIIEQNLGHKDFSFVYAFSEHN